jgi:hypothetical protein
VAIFHQLDKPHFSPERLGAGTRVLAWLKRGCTYAKDACGSFEVIRDDGVLLHDYSDTDDASDLAADPRPLRWIDLPRDTLRAGDIRKAPPWGRPNR